MYQTALAYSKFFKKNAKIMAEEEVKQSDIDDILNSPSKPPSGQSSPKQDDLPGGVDTQEEEIPKNIEEKRPSTTLEIDPEDGVATMSESAVLPARLPPLSDGGDSGFKPSYPDLASNISEVMFF